MSEEVRKLSAFEAFQQSQQTYDEAEAKAKQEAGTPKVERFRIGEDGEYTIRILPLAPNFDDAGNILPMDRKGYEYSVHQYFLTIKVPSKKGGKSKKLSIPVIRTTDKEVGYSVDLLDTYVKIAKEMYADDEDLIKFLTGSSYEGGIRWNYQHGIMVLDLTSDKTRAKGPQIWQCSHSQYKDIDAAKMRLWKELREEDGQETCPISGFVNAYPIKVIRKTDKKTEYTIEIGRKKADISESEAMSLLELPRIPELLFRYSRYHMEATLAFLQQFDEDHDMEVCKESDFIEAVEKLKGELPADDNSHFDIASSASKSNGKEEEVTISSLWAEYDNIVDQDLNEKSDEYQDLREKIRQFIEDNELDVRISRAKNNQQLLEEIDEAIDEKNKEVKSTKTLVAKPSSHVEAEVDDTVENKESDDSDSDGKSDAGADVEAPRRRKARPSADTNPIEEPAETQTAANEPEEAVAEETPRRRRRLR